MVNEITPRGAFCELITLSCRLDMLYATMQGKSRALYGIYVNAVNRREAFVSGELVGREIRRKETGKLLESSFSNLPSIKKYDFCSNMEYMSALLKIAARSQRNEIDIDTVEPGVRNYFFKVFNDDMSHALKSMIASMQRIVNAAELDTVRREKFERAVEDVTRAFQSIHALPLIERSFACAIQLPTHTQNDFLEECIRINDSVRDLVKGFFATSENAIQSKNGYKAKVAVHLTLFSDINRYMQSEFKRLYVIYPAKELETKLVYLESLLHQMVMKKTKEALQHAFDDMAVLASREIKATKSLQELQEKHLFLYREFNELIELGKTISNEHVLHIYEKAFHDLGKVCDDAELPHSLAFLKSEIFPKVLTLSQEIMEKTNRAELQELSVGLDRYILYIETVVAQINDKRIRGVVAGVDVLQEALKFLYVTRTNCKKRLLELGDKERKISSQDAVHTTQTISGEAPHVALNNSPNATVNITINQAQSGLGIQDLLKYGSYALPLVSALWVFKGLGLAWPLATWATSFLASQYVPTSLRPVVGPIINIASSLLAMRFGSTSVAATVSEVSASTGTQTASTNSSQPIVGTLLPRMVVNATEPANEADISPYSTSGWSLSSFLGQVVGTVGSALLIYGGSRAKREMLFQKMV